MVTEITNESDVASVAIQEVAIRSIAVGQFLRVNTQANTPLHPAAMLHIAAKAICSLGGNGSGSVTQRQTNNENAVTDNNKTNR